MKQDFDFFAYVSRMGLISRWALMRNSRTESDAEHSMFVASVAHALGLISKKIFGRDVSPEKMAVYALYHDVHEVLTGDMPTPIKHNNPCIASAYKTVEKAANDKLLSTLPPELKEEYDDVLNFSPLSREGLLVKAADTISAYVKCQEETSMGNDDFKSALLATKKRLEEMRLEEVDWFMQKFGLSFGKNLDSLD